MKNQNLSQILEQQSHYHSLIEGMLNGYAVNEIVLNYKHKPIGYQFLEVNKAFEALTGLKKEFVIGKNILDVLPKTEQKWIDICADVALNQKDICAEYFSPALNKTFQVRIFSPQKGIFITIFNDISSLKKAHLEVEKQKDSYESLFNNIRVGLIRTSINEGKILKANPACAELFGYSSLKKFMQNSIIHLFKDTDDRKAHRAKLLRNGKVNNTSLQMKKENGKSVTVSVSSTLHYEDNLPVWIDSTIQDISKQKRSEEKLFQLAHIDALTGLSNRYSFMSRLETSIQKASRYKHKCAVLFLDLDGFKGINDSYGHSAGDLVLTVTAQRLKNIIRKSDLVARMGGDEFTIIIEDFDNVRALNILGKKIIQAVSKNIPLQDTELSLTTSIGISIYPDDAPNLETLLKNADNAMYRAKELGKNTLQFFTKALNVDLVNKMVFENHLKKALGKEEFHLFYQPRITSDKREIIALEASLRWYSDSYGWVSPEDFFPVAMQSDIINKIFSWAIKSTCIALKKFQSQKIDLSLNLSIVTKCLESRYFFQELRKALFISKVEPSFLHLQVPQEALMKKNCLKQLQEIESLGVKIIIDNFGKGVTSIENFEKITIAGVKIDKSFIEDLNKQTPSQTLLTLINLAKCFNAKLIADSIESELQLLILDKLNVHQAQGGHIYAYTNEEQTKTLLATL